MSATINIRPALAEDLPALTRIYNHYIEHTAITFDTRPFPMRHVVHASISSAPGSAICY